ncbi:Oidioi.mRNA.OKI2018_I69.XSR.g13249.t1.cds [Oikopleura dioica]|uniref:Oidioi.mRNA.OKI2018_I69.XSR.g13249.t1.cds n=1 Tax=Oikopleura dioica TaxID=34765 RepID=A0ABN7SCG4_OIKDI|nr:Oidioi.mRNA.OKI2018_I69.XSR.g13249.t1.cds [Oikopleura dioica]
MRSRAEKSKAKTDIWRIEDEQAQFYFEAYRLECGEKSQLFLAKAVQLFQRSKLRQEELAIVWELAQIDNAKQRVSLPDFFVVFHLIVARRNGCPLPFALPPQLKSSALKQAEQIQKPLERRSIAELKNSIEQINKKNASILEAIKTTGVEIRRAQFCRIYREKHLFTKQREKKQVMF